MMGDERRKAIVEELKKRLPLPMDHFTDEMTRIGRAVYEDTKFEQRWEGDEYGVQVTWADGFSAFAGFGPIATAMIEAYYDKRRH